MSCLFAALHSIGLTLPTEAERYYAPVMSCLYPLYTAEEQSLCDL